MNIKFRFSFLQDPRYSWIKKSSTYDIIKNDFQTEEDYSQELEYAFCGTDCQDIRKIIDTIRFWGLYYLPIEFYIILLHEKPIELLNEIIGEIGNDELFKFLLMICTDDDITEYAIQHEHVDYLAYYLSINKSDWNIYLSINAAKNKSKKCLQFLHEHGCPIKNPKVYVNENICETAALYDSIECLEYARKNGCSWGKKTCINAAISNSYECLKFAHERGCHWTKEVVWFSINSGSYNCLVYAHQNGCDFDVTSPRCLYLNTSEKLRCMRYYDEIKQLV